MPDQSYAASLREAANKTVRAWHVEHPDPHDITDALLDSIDLAISAADAYAIASVLEQAARGFAIRNGEAPVGFALLRTALAALDRRAQP